MKIIDVREREQSNTIQRKEVFAPSVDRKQNEKLMVTVK